MGQRYFLWFKPAFPFSGNCCPIFQEVDLQVKVGVIERCAIEIAVAADSPALISWSTNGIGRAGFKHAVKSVGEAA